MQDKVQKKLESAVKRYRELANITKELKHADTPFIESSDKDYFCAPCADGPWLERCWCKGRYPEASFGSGVGTRVDKPSKLPIDTESVGDKGDNRRKGRLADSACAILMHVLFAARVGRFDLLHAIGALASRISDWSEQCDRY